MHVPSFGTLLQTNHLVAVIKISVTFSGRLSYLETTCTHLSPCNRKAVQTLAKYLFIKLIKKCSINLNVKDDYRKQYQSLCWKTDCVKLSKIFRPKLDLFQNLKQL